MIGHRHVNIEEMSFHEVAKHRVIMTFVTYFRITGTNKGHTAFYSILCNALNKVLLIIKRFAASQQNKTMHLTIIIGCQWEPNSSQYLQLPCIRNQITFVTRIS